MPVCNPAAGSTLAARPGRPIVSRNDLSVSGGSEPVSSASRTPRCSARVPRSRKALREHLAPGWLVDGRNRAGAHQNDLGAQLISHREGAVSPANAVVELVGGVERPSRRQRNRHERQLDRIEHMAHLAPACLAQPMRRELADGVEHDAPGTKPSRLVHLVASRMIGVEAKRRAGGGSSWTQLSHASKMVATP